MAGSFVPSMKLISCLTSSLSSQGGEEPWLEECFRWKRHWI